MTSGARSHLRNEEDAGEGPDEPHEQPGRQSQVSQEHQRCTQDKVGLSQALRQSQICWLNFSCRVHIVLIRIAMLSAHDPPWRQAD
jgi:hypothetical protein